MRRQLLLDERPLIVMPKLAVVIGLNESIFIQQLHYWLERSTNIQEGYRWVYNTAPEWQKQFPFWSVNTIRRITKSLEEQGLIVIDKFNKLAIDKTNWYRINYEKVEDLELEIHESEKSHSTTQVGYSSTQSGHSKQSEWVVEAPKLGRPLPEITTKSTTESTHNNNDNSISSESSMKKSSVPKEPPAVVADDSFGELITFYQENIGLITPLISESLGMMSDELNAELALLALKESVIANAKNKMRYAQAILNSWKSQNYQTASDVENAEKRRRTNVEARKDEVITNHPEGFEDW